MTSDEKGRSMDMATPIFSNRGLARWPLIDTQHGHEVHVYESSMATDPSCMWLSISGSAHMYRPGASVVGEGVVSAHMSHENVEALRAQLDAWLELHAEAIARAKSPSGS